MHKLLSMVIPVITPNLYLLSLLKSIGKPNSTEMEIVIVNQTGVKLPDYLTKEVHIQVVDYITDRIPAANARNIGASLASGEYVFFLDDDAVFYSNEKAIEDLLLELRSNTDVLIVQRGEIMNGTYNSHWPTETRLNLRNFSRFAIEWNLIIKKTVFSKLGGFPEIGPGSPHAALCGEAFVLMSKIIGANLSVLLWPSVQIAHPGLFEKPRPLMVALGYSYGAGYAVGLSWFSFDSKWKVYWVFRVIGASFSDLFLRHGELMHTIEKVNRLKYRSKLAKCRLYGFFDAMSNKPPRSLAWLEHDASKIMPK